ncbi:MAG TPA: hypothetical protein VGK73_24975 [Polyangiaceae bacterium]
MADSRNPDSVAPPAQIPSEAPPPPPSAASPFNRAFPRSRSEKQPRQTSGRILPPAPAWMAKPLKPPMAKPARPKSEE